MCMFCLLEMHNHHAQQCRKMTSLQPALITAAFEMTSRRSAADGGCAPGNRWWKKCPLEISHQHLALLSQQKSFFLFASDGFAKTQW